MTSTITSTYVCPGHVDFIKNFASEKMAKKRASEFVVQYLKDQNIETASSVILERKDKGNIFKKVFAFAFNKYALEIKYFHKIGHCPDEPKPTVVIVDGRKA